MNTGTASSRSTHIEEVYRIARESGSSFYYAFRLLPRERREGLYAVYSFCRLVDDAVDEAESSEAAERDLDFWDREVDACYSGTPMTPVGIILAETAAKYSVPSELLKAIIAGARMDLTINRYNTFEELKVYCDRVAGAVGQVCIRVFGVEEEGRDEYSLNLGAALQLINIARDVSRDVDRDRIYLPREDLARFGVPEEEILRRVYSPRFADLMRHHCGRAREFLLAADPRFARRTRHRLYPAEAMGATYRLLLEKIEQMDYNVFQARPRVSTRCRLRLAVAAWARSVWFRLAW